MNVYFQNTIAWKTRGFFYFAVLAFFCLTAKVPLSEAAPPGAAANPKPYRYVKVEGRQLLTDFDRDGTYQPYYIKGVGYEATPIGRYPSGWGWPEGDPRSNHQNILDDDAILTRDFTFLQQMHTNTIRLWSASDNTSNGRFPDKMTFNTLKYARDNNIKIIAGFWVSPFVANTETDITKPAVRNDILTRFRTFVTTFKHRPEILFWAIGNENNLFLDPGNPAQVEAWYSLVNEMGGIVREVEGDQFYHPVAVSNGNLGFIGESAFGAADVQLPFVDIWGSNVYWGISFGDFFYQHSLKSSKPLWVSEYGIDAFNAVDFSTPDIGQENQALQAEWDSAMCDEILSNSDITIGATIMAYADQWWQPNEWLCEEAPENCQSVVTSPQTTLFWDPRLNATGYRLVVGTWFKGNDIDNETAFSTIRSRDVDVPVSSFSASPQKSIYVQLIYQMPTGRDITEYFEFPTSASPTDSRVRIKLKRVGVVHNHYGTGPTDNSNPRDGVFDFYPPTPDYFWHQEWWGIMSSAPNGYAPDILTPRAVYYALQSRFDPARPDTIKAYLALPFPGTVINTAEVKFRWSRGRGVSQYSLEVGKSPGAKDVYYLPSTTSTSVTFKGIRLDGKPLYVRLKSNINGTWSSKDYAYSTITDRTPPGVPKALQAFVFSPNTIYLTWNPTTDNSGEVSYTIYRKTGLAGSANPYSSFVGTGLTNYTDGRYVPLAPSTSYTYKIQANDRMGNRSAFSGEVTVTTPAAPPVGNVGIGNRGI